MALEAAFCTAMVAEASRLPQNLTRQQLESITPAIPHLRLSLTGPYRSTGRTEAYDFAGPGSCDPLRCRQPHLREAAEVWSDGPSDGDLFWPFFALAVFHEGRGQDGEAERWWRDCLARTELRLGSEHPKVAILLNNLAQLLKATNRLSEAEPLMRRALDIDQVSFGSEHPKVAILLNNLAQLLKATNRLTEAEPLMRRAFEILDASLGPEHPNTKIVGGNLEMLLRRLKTSLATDEP